MMDKLPVDAVVGDPLAEVVPLVRLLQQELVEQSLHLNRLLVAEMELAEEEALWKQSQQFPDLVIASYDDSISHFLVERCFSAAILLKV